MKNPLFKKVEKIVIARSQGYHIHHVYFSHIRNQNCVKSAMIEMGYYPDCNIKPKIWTIKPSAGGEKNEST